MEGDREHTFLHLVQLQHLRQQQRADIGNRGADRMTLFAVKVPEHRRGGLAVQGNTQLGGPFGKFLGSTRLGDTRQITLHIGAENRNTGIGKALGHNLKGHGFSCAGCAGDNPVAVGAVQQKSLRLTVEGLAKNYRSGVRHSVLRRLPVRYPCWVD